MEVVVITHKGGQRSDGSVSIHSSDRPDSSTHTPYSTKKFNTSVKLSLLITCRCVLFLSSNFVEILFECNTVKAYRSRSIQLSAGTFFVQ